MVGRQAVEHIERTARAVAERIVGESDVPGVALAVRLDVDVAFEMGVGYGDPRGGRPLAPTCAFPLYSITKVILATAITRLVEEGSLSLTESVVTRLPDYPVDGAITVEHLLNHTSGLPDYGSLPDYGHDVRRHPGLPWSERAFYERTMTRGALFSPGTGWSYSNLGYMLVRLLVESITGQPLRDALDALVFAPAGLRHTRGVSTVDALAELASGYSSQLDDDGQLRFVNGRYHPGWVAHGLVASTAAETAQLLDALLAGRLVDQASLAHMLEAVPVPVRHPWIRKPGYGLGLMVDLGSTSGVLAGHAGGGPGFATAAFHFSDVHGHGLTAVALANSEAGDIATSIVFETAMLAEGVLADSAG